MNPATLQPVSSTASTPPPGRVPLRPLGLRDFPGGGAPPGSDKTGPLMQPLQPQDVVAGKPPGKGVGPREPLEPLNQTDFVPGLRKKEEPSREQELTHQAQKWVAQTFFGTLLKQMRDSPFKSDIFDGGHGGQAFTSMYDQQLAERMSRGAGSGKLVRGIVRRLEGKKAYDKQTGLKSPDAAGAGVNQAELATPVIAPPLREERNHDLNNRRQSPTSQPAPVGSGGDNPFTHVRIHVAPGLRD
jgi:Rod binding domain-containing protein